MLIKVICFVILRTCRFLQLLTIHKYVYTRRFKFIFLFTLIFTGRHAAAAQGLAIGTTVVGFILSLRSHNCHLGV